jgi:hypothetical protein
MLVPLNVSSPAERISIKSGAGVYINLSHSNIIFLHISQSRNLLYFTWTPNRNTYIKFLKNGLPHKLINVAYITQNIEEMEI